MRWWMFVEAVKGREVKRDVKRIIRGVQGLRWCWYGWQGGRVAGARREGCGGIGQE